MRTIKTPGVCRCGKPGCDGTKTVELFLKIESDDESEALDDIADFVKGEAFKQFMKVSREISKAMEKAEPTLNKLEAAANN